MNAPFYIDRHTATPAPRRRPFDGPWKPHWPRIGALILTATPWAVIGAGVGMRLRVAPADLALIGLAVGYGALCLAALAFMAWSLALVILNTVVEPLARRFARPVP